MCIRHIPGKQHQYKGVFNCTNVVWQASVRDKPYVTARAKLLSGKYRRPSQIAVDGAGIAEMCFAAGKIQPHNGIKYRDRANTGGKRTIFRQLVTLIQYQL